MKPKAVLKSGKVNVRLMDSLSALCTVTVSAPAVDQQAATQQTTGGTGQTGRLTFFQAERRRSALVS